jgi:putative hydrolase of the HAD superfamily
MDTLQSPPKALLVDIGGVLLTNGWDTRMRRDAARMFGLELEEVEERHHLAFGTYEEGRLTLDQYLSWVVFFAPRPFSREEFKEYIFKQSEPYPEMIALIADVKRRHGLKIAAVSNEGRELTVQRVGTFGLGRFIDFFVCSCFVNLRKPDLAIYRTALDMLQIDAGEALYIDDRELFVEVATECGIRGIHHTDLGATRAQLAKFGLDVGTSPVGD